MQAPINPQQAIKRRYIDEVEISNFKFFPNIDNENKPIKIDGKHLLVYGENGSGKSSFYWALYTLLECANKPNNKEIEKYFEYDGEESLLNINAIQRPEPNAKKAENAYIKIKLKDDPNLDYLISYDDVSIRTKLEPQISNYASDFINYRVLYSAFNYAHSEEVDLYHHFKYTVFPYVKFDDPCKIWVKNETTGSWDETIVLEANPIIKFLENGAFFEVQANDRRKYSLSKPLVKDVKQSVSSIKATLRKLLTHINTKGNEILKDLGYPNFDFQLEFIEDTKEVIGTVTYNPPRIKILLKNKTYDGKANKVHRIHSFFNEAKLTAVSLAIRLSVLEKKPDDAQVKILVLDDLMISLDMNNRAKVIDYVFKSYLSKYQTLFFTHDKSLFEFVQLKISEWDKISNWEIKEMYCGSTNKPVILEKNLDLIKRADAYFKAFDYYSAGNNIRKAIEKRLEELLPETIRITTRDLDHQIKQLFEFYDNNECGDLISLQLRNELLQYKDIVFNPSSHFDLRSPLYKTEIEKAFDVHKILNTIPKITLHLLAGMRASLFYSNTALNYSAQYILRENFYAVSAIGNAVRLSDPKHTLVTYTFNGTLFLDLKTGASKTAAQITDSKNKVIKMSERLERIKKFIASSSPIDLMHFTLTDGSTIGQLASMF